MSTIDVPLSVGSQLQSDRILVIDHDAATRRLLMHCFEDAGMEVKEASNGKEAWAIMAKYEPHLITLEQNLPGEDGLQLLREICSTRNAAIIIVSDRSRVMNRIVGLEMGADDFVPKPFDVDELTARVRAVLRRARRAAASQLNEKVAQASSSGGRYKFEAFDFDCGRRQLQTGNGTPIELTSMEFDLLAIFVLNSQRPMSRLAIIESLGKECDSASVRTIDVLISKLRRKIEPNERHPQIIKTVRGAGYVFTPNVSTAS